MNDHKFTMNEFAARKKTYTSPEKPAPPKYVLTQKEMTSYPIKAFSIFSVIGSLLSILFLYDDSRLPITIFIILLLSAVGMLFSIIYITATQYLNWRKAHRKWETDYHKWQSQITNTK